MDEDERSQKGSTEEAVPVTTYPYNPLDPSIDSIRLLRIEPAPISEPLQCKLIHATFASKPKYEAISYTWGPPDVVETVDIDGYNVHIRENLYWALCHARNKNKNQPRFLWADAICINQDDLQERNRQVGLMAFIYSRAQAVLIWLGRPSKEDDVIQIAGNFLSTNLYRWLCDRSYWRRVWIVQEIGLARKLLCYYELAHETVMVDWSEFISCVSNYVKDESADLTLKLHHQREGRYGDMNQLEMLLASFADADCSEPRDKIYGFLGLAHDCQEGELKVNYAKSLFELYVEVITFQYSTKPLIEGLPPTIDRSMRLVRFSHLLQKMFAGGIDAEVAAYRATHNSIPNIPSSINLIARGFIEGAVVHIGPSYSDLISSYDASRRWRSSFGRSYDTLNDLSLLRELDDAYTSTILEMDETGLSKTCAFDPPSTFHNTPKALPCNEDWLKGTPLHARDIKAYENSDYLTRFPTPQDAPSTTQPQLFLSTNRTMGLCPPNTRVGDLICRFWDCDDVAAILRWERKLEGFSNYFQNGSEYIALPKGPINSDGIREVGQFRILGRADVATAWRKSEDRPVKISETNKWEGGGVVNLLLDVKTLMALTR